MAETAQRVQDVIRFIDRNLGERLTLVEMATVLELNPYHFAHVFKQATGLAPHQYVIQRRLARAKQLLGTTNLPIAEVALAVGCANQSHFSALFHRATGMTPLAYRIRNKAAVDVATASLRYTAREAAGKLAESGESSTPLTFTGR